MNAQESFNSLIGIADAARALGVSVFTVRRLAATGNLKTVNVGARRLVPVSEVARIVATGAGTPRKRKVTANASGARHSVSNGNRRR